MKVDGHVDMTRDAVLLTAEDVAGKVAAALGELAAAGVNVDPAVFIERRLQALVTFLIPDADDQARLELAYQETMLAWIDTVRDDAIAAARKAQLTAPPGAFAQAVNGRH